MGVKTRQLDQTLVESFTGGQLFSDRFAGRRIMRARGFPFVGAENVCQEMSTPLIDDNEQLNIRWSISREFRNLPPRIF